MAKGERWRSIVCLLNRFNRTKKIYAFASCFNINMFTVTNIKFLFTNCMIFNVKLHSTLVALDESDNEDEPAILSLRVPLEKLLSAPLTLVFTFKFNFLLLHLESSTW